jgi:UDP-N-acetylmuramate--alanine ligase
MSKSLETNTFDLGPGGRVHLVGIGGSGMSAIARVLLGLGYAVSGSDQQANELTAALRAEGATVYIGHEAEQIAGADVLAISSAIPEENPEVVAARAARIPVLKREQLLGHLMRRRRGIAVAGTHGKTTTTGMLAEILLVAESDPTIIVGGVLPRLESNGRAGQGPYVLIEADEYDHMFLGLRPQVIVVTNVEHDHPDVFPTPAAYRQAFADFVRLLPAGGMLVVCGEDREALALLDEAGPGVRKVAYGLDAWSGPDDCTCYQAMDMRVNQLGGTDFLLQRDGETAGLFRLRVPGRHNVLNGLAAAAVALEEGIGAGVLQRALMDFGGVGRRFQVQGEIGDVTVIDDYAHHPTEIRATLAAARERYPGRRVWAVWQPHTYSRTRLLLDEFAAAFAGADRVIVLDIYRSREKEDPTIDAAAVVARMAHSNAVHVGAREDAAAYLLDRVAPGDVVLTLGAGDGDAVGRWVVDGLRRRLNVEE